MEEKFAEKSVENCIFDIPALHPLLFKNIAHLLPFYKKSTINDYLRNVSNKKLDYYPLPFFIALLYYK